MRDRNVWHSAASLPTRSGSTARNVHYYTPNSRLTHPRGAHTWKTIGLYICSRRLALMISALLPQYLVLSVFSGRHTRRSQTQDLKKTSHHSHHDYRRLRLLGHSGVAEGHECMSPVVVSKFFIDQQTCCGKLELCKILLYLFLSYLSTCIWSPHAHFASGEVCHQTPGYPLPCLPHSPKW